MVKTYAPEALAPLFSETRDLGRLLLERQADVSYGYKPDGTVLSDLDELIQHRIFERLSSLPDAALRNAHLVGEERLADGGLAHSLKPGSWNWVVDGLDGTAAYTKGFNVFSISIALLDGDLNPMLGLVHAPGLGGRFDFVSAHRGRLERFAVRFDRDQATISPVSAACSPPPGWPAPESVGRSYCYGGSDLHRHLPDFGGKVRNLGATATHLALLSDCGSDPAAVLLSRCSAWDVAAGLALADAAGLETRPMKASTAMRPAEVLAGDDGLPLPLLVGHPAVLDTIQAPILPS